MTQQSTDATASAPATTPTWIVASIAAAFGLLYAYAVFNAVGNLVAVIRAAGEQGLTLNALGWSLWLFAALLPILVWTLALSLGRRRGARGRVLIMLAGLALVAVFWLDAVAYATTAPVTTFVG